MPQPLPTPRRLLAIWTRIGLQSFGGGQAVILLGYDALVSRGGWITPEGWSEAWGVNQVVPGVSVIGMCALTGLRLAGPLGAVASLVGLMVPSAAITIAITAVFAQLQGSNLVRGALRGIAFAAAGGSLAMTYRIVRPRPKNRQLLDMRDLA